MGKLFFILDNKPYKLRHSKVCAFFLRPPHDFYFIFVFMYIRMYLCTYKLYRFLCTSPTTTTPPPPVSPPTGLHEPLSAAGDSVSEKDVHLVVADQNVVV